MNYPIPLTNFISFNKSREVNLENSRKDLPLESVTHIFKLEKKNRNSYLKKNKELEMEKQKG